MGNGAVHRASRDLMDAYNKAVAAGVVDPTREFSEVRAKLAEYINNNKVGDERTRLLKELNRAGAVSYFIRAMAGPDRPGGLHGATPSRQLEQQKLENAQNTINKVKDATDRLVVFSTWDKLGTFSGISIELRKNLKKAAEYGDYLDEKGLRDILNEAIADLAHNGFLDLEQFRLDESKLAELGINPAKWDSWENLKKAVAYLTSEGRVNYASTQVEIDERRLSVASQVNEYVDGLAGDIVRLNGLDSAIKDRIFDVTGAPDITDIVNELNNFAASSDPGVRRWRERAIEIRYWDIGKIEELYRRLGIPFDGAGDGSITARYVGLMKASVDEINRSRIMELFNLASGERGNDLAASVLADKRIVVASSMTVGEGAVELEEPFGNPMYLNQREAYGIFGMLAGFEILSSGSAFARTGVERPQDVADAITLTRNFEDAWLRMLVALNGAGTGSMGRGVFDAEFAQAYAEAIGYLDTLDTVFPRTAEGEYNDAILKMREGMNFFQNDAGQLDLDKAWEGARNELEDEEQQLYRNAIANITTGITGAYSTAYGVNPAFETFNRAGELQQGAALGLLLNGRGVLERIYPDTSLVDIQTRDQIRDALLSYIAIIYDSSEIGERKGNFDVFYGHLEGKSLHTDELVARLLNDNVLIDRYGNIGVNPVAITGEPDRYAPRYGNLFAMLDRMMHRSQLGILSPVVVAPQIATIYSSEIPQETEQAAYRARAFKGQKHEKFYLQRITTGGIERVYAADLAVALAVLTEAFDLAIARESMPAFGRGRARFFGSGAFSETENLQKTKGGAADEQIRNRSSYLEAGERYWEGIIEEDLFRTEAQFLARGANFKPVDDMLVRNLLGDYFHSRTRDFDALFPGFDRVTVNDDMRFVLNSSPNRGKDLVVTANRHYESSQAMGEAPGPLFAMGDFSLNMEIAAGSGLAVALGFNTMEPGEVARVVGINDYENGERLVEMDFYNAEGEMIGSVSLLSDPVGETVSMYGRYNATFGYDPQSGRVFPHGAGGEFEENFRSTDEVRAFYRVGANCWMELIATNDASRKKMGTIAEELGPKFEEVKDVQNYFAQYRNFNYVEQGGAGVQTRIKHDAVRDATDVGFFMGIGNVDWRAAGVGVATVEKEGGAAVEKHIGRHEFTIGYYELDRRRMAGLATGYGSYQSTQGGQFTGGFQSIDRQYTGDQPRTQLGVVKYGVRHDAPPNYPQMLRGVFAASLGEKREFMGGSLGYESLDKETYVKGFGFFSWNEKNELQSFRAGMEGRGYMFMPLEGFAQVTQYQGQADRKRYTFALESPDAAGLRIQVTGNLTEGQKAGLASRLLSAPMPEGVKSAYNSYRELVEQEAAEGRKRQALDQLASAMDSFFISTDAYSLLRSLGQGRNDITVAVMDKDEGRPAVIATVQQMGRNRGYVAMLWDVTENFAVVGEFDTGRKGAVAGGGAVVTLPEAKVPVLGKGIKLLFVGRAATPMLESDKPSFEGSVMVGNERIEVMKVEGLWRVQFTHAGVNYQIMLNRTESEEYKFTGAKGTYYWNDWRLAAGLGQTLYQEIIRKQVEGEIGKVGTIYSVPGYVGFGARLEDVQSRQNEDGKTDYMFYFKGSFSL